MIYNNIEQYRIIFYTNSLTGEKPVLKFIDALNPSAQAKIHKYINYLKHSNGYLDEPYSRHIFGSIRELRVDFSNIRHRIFYFTFVGKKIIFLHGFVKKTAKTPTNELRKAIQYYQDIIANPSKYE